jgi:cytochrome c biogenesis protein CcmG, thiol:disulfide interchange protein DsbE
MTRFAAILLAAAPFLWAEPVNAPAPELEVKLENGQILKLSQLKGRPVLVEFFLPTCPHCQESAASIEKLLRNYGPKGLEIVSVVTDETQRSGFAEFRRKYGATYKMGSVNRDDSYRFFQLSMMKPFYVPSFAFVDRNGVMTERFVGGMQTTGRDAEYAALARSVEAIMKPAARPAAAAAGKKK